MVSAYLQYFCKAVENLRDNGIPLNFPNLFVECVEVAKQKYDVEVTEVDANYLAARIYAADRKYGKTLEKLGFPVVY